MGSAAWASRLFLGGASRLARHWEDDARSTQRRSAFASVRAAALRRRLKVDCNGAAAFAFDFFKSVSATSQFLTSEVRSMIRFSFGRNLLRSPAGNQGLNTCMA